jgi:hypothetical protein
LNFYTSRDIPAAYAVIVIDEVRTGFTEAAAAQDCYLGATARKHAQQI